MTRRVGLLVVGILLFAVAGCSDDGGGGDEAAFCDELEALSDQVADGDLSSEDGLEDLTERANDLIAVAGSDQEDAVQAVGEELSEASPDDAEDVAELIQDELGDIAEDVCEIDGDEFAVAELDETTTTTEPDGTTTTTEPDGTTTTQGGGGNGELNLVGAPVSPADIGLEAGFEENADLCFRGFMQACDDIFFGENGQTAAPQDSVARSYGGTCGGRIQSFVNDAIRCDQNLFAASTFDIADFTDASFEPLATACQGNDSVDGDMASCDTLFAQTGIDTFEELYGDTCGGRIDFEVADRDASCVAIFGAVAEFG